MVGAQLVVLQHRVVIGADIFDRTFIGGLFVLVAIGPAELQCRRRLGAGILQILGAVAVEFGNQFFPGLLRDHENADAELRHDLDRLRTDRRRIGASAERLERAGTDFAARLLDVFAVKLAIAVLQPFEKHLRILDEGAAALVHVEAIAFELDAPEPASDAEDHAAIRHMVEHRHFFRDAHRVVPRQHDDSRAELDILGAAREIGQELRHVRAHRVVGEVMLDAP